MAKSDSAESINLKTALRLRNEFINLSDASRLAEKHPATAWHWKKTYNDFPKHAGSLKGINNQRHKAYKRIEIQAWLIRHGLIDPIDGIDPDDYLAEYIDPKKKDEPPPAFDNQLARRFLTCKPINSKTRTQTDEQLDPI